MAEDLAERIRRLTADHPGIGEIRMFGGHCFTLNGNMLLGVLKGGDLMARVGEAQEPQALAKPGAARMNFTGREMRGFVTIDAGTVDDDALRDWFSMSAAYVGALPPKEKKAKNGAARRRP